MCRDGDRASDRRHLPSSARELLHASMVSDAKTMAERICSNIESTPLLAGTNVSVSVAVTVGGSEPVTEIADPADVALAFVSRSGGSIVVHD